MHLKTKPTSSEHFRFLFILEYLKKLSIKSFIHICHYICQKCISDDFYGIRHQTSTKETQKPRNEMRDCTSTKLEWNEDDNIYSSFVCITEWNESGKKKRREANIEFNNNEWTNIEWEKWRKWNDLNEIVKCKAVHGMGRKYCSSHSVFFHFPMKKKKKRSRLFYQRYVMQSIIYNVLCSSSFRSMFNVHCDIILFTGANCNTCFAFASKFVFYLHLPLCIPPCTSPCVVYSCDVYLMKKSPLKRRIKRIETFIICVLFRAL